MYLPLALIFLVSALLCIAVLSIAVVLGKKCGLVDHPKGRKHHVGDIPLVGGLSIFLTFLVMQFSTPTAIALVVAGGLLLIVGIADDMLDLPARGKLLLQGLAASIMVWGGGYQINNLSGLVSNESFLITGLGGLLFSVICIIGVINAINMIDGADGLAGGIVAISLAALLALAVQQNAETIVINNLTIVLAAILSFLLFNSGVFGLNQKVFLGDSGSMFLGIFFAAYCIGMSQSAEPLVSPVIAGWIFGLPLIDSISVIVARLRKGKSPFCAGRDHLHHRLINTGLTPGSCVIVMLSLHSFLVIIGLIGNYFAFSSQLLFWSFVTLIIAYHFISPKVIDNLEPGRARHRARRYN